MSEAGFQERTVEDIPLGARVPGPARQFRSELQTYTDLPGSGASEAAVAGVTLVSSCAKSPCSSSFLLLPVYKTITSPVEMSQIAPTILQALGLDANSLEAVQEEGTQPLPGLDFNTGTK